MSKQIKYNNFLFTINPIKDKELGIKVNHLTSMKVFQVDKHELKAIRTETVIAALELK
jgi:hypothetical protein